MKIEGIVKSFKISSFWWLILLFGGTYCWGHLNFMNLSIRALHSNSNVSSPVVKDSL